MYLLYKHLLCTKNILIFQSNNFFQVCFFNAQLDLCYLDRRGWKVQKPLNKSDHYQKTRRQKIMVFR